MRREKQIKMFKGVGSVPAVNSEPLYARPEHKIWFVILIYFNCVSLVVCGAVGLVFACLHYKYLVHCFLGVYMVLFGVISLLADLRLGFAQRVFGFACTPVGLGMVFIFSGTLGISFGVGKSLGLLFPFVGGIVSIAVGVCSLFESQSSVVGIESI